MSGHSLDDLVRSFEYSSYRENLFEQIFCSELLQGCWRAGLGPIEIDRPFVDFQGYDLVATCGAVVRHIQLKGSRGGQLAIHRRLATKPSACVVNLVSRVTPDDTRIEFVYYFFGAAPGKALDITGLAPARKAFNTLQADNTFAKVERVNHVRLPQARFEGPLSMAELATRLFGSTPTDAG